MSIEKTKTASTGAKAPKDEFSREEIELLQFIAKFIVENAVREAERQLIDSDLRDT